MSGKSFESPEAALNELLEKASEEEEWLPIYVNSREITDVVDGKIEPEQLIYRRIIGNISIEEPEVDLGGEEPWPAFGISIEYHHDAPDRNEVNKPDHYWEVGTAQTQHPYTEEDAEERVDEIIQVLKDNDHTVEKGDIL